MIKTSLAAFAITSLTLAPLHAAGPKGPQAPHGNPHTTTAPAPAATAAHGQSASHGATTTHGSPKTTTATKSHGNPHTTTATSSGATTSTGGTTTSTGTTSSTSSTGSTTTATTPLNPIAQKLQGKPLGSRLEKMLPKDM